MKIGIITFTNGCNFGQRLQNYAMQELLKEYADQVYTFQQKKTRYGIKYRIKKTVCEVMSGYSLLQMKREKLFRKFDQRYVNYSDEKIGQGCNPTNIDDYDYFVTGSDQVWSPYSADVNATMFLTFAPREKRICYAPSIASNEIPSEKEALYREYLSGFERLSLREHNLAEYIQKLTGKKVNVVTDPTLFFGRDFWERIETKPRYMPEDKYVLFYFLGENQKSKKIRSQLERKGYRVIDLMHERRVYAIDPSHFLYLIHHAELVVTDSYHGTIFSMIFHTPFAVSERVGTRLDMSSRFDTLDLMFGIGQRKINQLEESDLFSMDFKGIDDKIQRECSRSRMYLECCLNCCG